jgi:hypothetical protein
MKGKSELDVGRLLSGLGPPAPPEVLRAQVLEKAGRQLIEAATPDRWARIWFDRRLRLAWAATVVLLLIGHALAGLPAGTLHLRAAPRVAADGGLDEPLADLLRPVRISEHVQPIVGLSAPDGDPTGISIGGHPS